MKEIKLVRVDDRLIHAQIILFWLKKLNINAIFIVDDQLANNTFLCNIYRLTTPPHIGLKIFSIDQAIDYFNNNKIDATSRIMILIKNLNNLVSMHKKGFQLNIVQIGGSVLENGWNKRQIIDYIITNYHLEISYLISNNINIYCQNSTSDEKLYIHQAH